MEDIPEEVSLQANNYISNPHICFRLQGNMHITTIDKKGKNFHVVQQVATMIDGKRKNGSSTFNPLASIFGDEFEKAMQEDKKVGKVIFINISTPKMAYFSLKCSCFTL